MNITEKGNQMSRLENLDLTAITLEECLAEINDEAADRQAANAEGWYPGLVSDLAHWAEYGITTAVELGEYLGAAVAQEEDKCVFIALDAAFEDSRTFTSADLEVDQVW